MTFPGTWEIPDIDTLAAALGVHAPWREQALCRTADPSLFDAAKRGEGAGRWRRYPERVQRAVRTYCEPCPVREDCRAFAAQANTEGVWGGEWRHRPSGRQRIEIVTVDLPESA